MSLLSIHSFFSLSLSQVLLSHFATCAADALAVSQLEQQLLLPSVVTSRKKRRDACKDLLLRLRAQRQALISSSSSSSASSSSRNSAPTVLDLKTRLNR